MKLIRSLALLAVATVLATSVAAAARLTVSSKTLGSGGTAVAHCQNGGFTFTRTVSSGNITAVAVGGITSGCANGALILTLVNSSNASIGSGTASIPAACSGCSVTVSVSPQPAASSLNAYRLEISGP